MSDLEDIIAGLLKKGYEIDFRNSPTKENRVQIELRKDERYFKVDCSKDVVFSFDEWSLAMEVIMVEQMFRDKFDEDYEEY